MLEISIMGVIALAAVYCAALWLMGRHEDVLYGDFVTEVASGPSHSPEPAKRPVPRNVQRTGQTLPRPVAQPIVVPSNPVSADRLHRAMELAAVATPLLPAPAMLQSAKAPDQIPPRPQALPPAAAQSRDDLLASLLATIKRDLDDVARI